MRVLNKVEEKEQLSRDLHDVITKINQMIIVANNLGITVMITQNDKIGSKISFVNVFVHEVTSY